MTPHKDEVETVIENLIAEHNGTDFPARLIFERLPDYSPVEIARVAQEVMLDFAQQFHSQAKALQKERVRRSGFKVAGGLPHD